MGTHPIFESDFDCLTAVELEQATLTATATMASDEKDKLLIDLKQLKQTNDETNKVVKEQEILNQQLTAQLRQLEAASRLSANQANDEKKKNAKQLRVRAGHDVWHERGDHESK